MCACVCEFNFRPRKQPHSASLPEPMSKRGIGLVGAIPSTRSYQDRTNPSLGVGFFFQGLVCRSPQLLVDQLPQVGQ